MRWPCGVLYSSCGRVAMGFLSMSSTSFPMHSNKHYSDRPCIQPGNRPNYVTHVASVPPFRIVARTLSRKLFGNINLRRSQGINTFFCRRNLDCKHSILRRRLLFFYHLIFFKFNSFKLRKRNIRTCHST